jgi:hypothetical protein
VGYGITGFWDFNSLQKRAVLYLATVRPDIGAASGNRKFRPGNHRSFERKLWEHEISTNGPGPVGLNAELRNHRSFKRKLWKQEIPARKPQIF